MVNHDKGPDGARLPITDIFASQRTHEERARWLLAAPLDVIRRDHLAISEICSMAGFRLGVAYVSAELAALTSVRRCGEVSAWHQCSVETLRALLRQEAGYRSKSWFNRWKFW